MKAGDLIKKYINQSNILQLATSVKDMPWVVTLHFYADEDLNLYWSSRHNRRHSQEVLTNPNASATILVHENTQKENWVIGVTLSGQAELVEDLNDSIAQAYVKKLLKDPDLPLKIRDGSVPDKWYRLKPETIILFDNKDFPENPRQVINL
jgi:nitroimidazol reductase NimA-like FMN-containing flavoprotein (pyridoxamine 5'-phosphate oxidase superfamily)